MFGLLTSVRMMLSCMQTSWGSLDLDLQVGHMSRKFFLLSAMLLAASSLVFAQGGLSMGMGHSSVFRVGPGKDSAGVQVYSFNYMYAAVIFDAQGKVVDIEFDGLEVATPNYDGSSMPHFPGWPGAPAYNLTDHETKKVTGTMPATVETATATVEAWKTKRDRGDAYGMNPKNDWFRQMDAFEKVFIGKTVEEIEKWATRYLSDVNGRPLNPVVNEKTNPKDVAKVAPLTADEKSMLADVRTGATMSLNDAHGSMVSLIRDAWNKRKPVMLH